MGADGKIGRQLIIERQGDCVRRFNEAGDSKQIASTEVVQ